MQIHERKMEFGDDGAGLRERLIQQILAGVKTATCDLKEFCSAQEIRDLDGPFGWHETVLDGAGRARCNIRVTEVYETTFGNPDPRLVRGEGNGDDAAEFQRGHEHFFAPLLKAKGLPALAEDSLLVVWEFELAETPE